MAEGESGLHVNSVPVFLELPLACVDCSLTAHSSRNSTKPDGTSGALLVWSTTDCQNKVSMFARERSGCYFELKTLKEDMLSNRLHTNNLTCDREGRLGITVHLYYKKRAHPEIFFAFGHCLKIVG